MNSDEPQSEDMSETFVSITVHPAFLEFLSIPKGGQGSYPELIQKIDDGEHGEIDDCLKFVKALCLSAVGNEAEFEKLLLELQYSDQYEVRITSDLLLTDINNEPVDNSMLLPKRFTKGYNQSLQTLIDIYDHSKTLDHGHFHVEAAVKALKGLVSFHRLIAGRRNEKLYERAVEILNAHRLLEEAHTDPTNDDLGP